MPNIARTLEKRLPRSTLAHLRGVADVCQGHGHGAYLVGGVVRDVLLGRTNADVDISIEGAEPEFDAALAGALGGELAARSEFGTSKLRIGDSVIDLVMARSERYEHPGALPSVSPGSIHDDLTRRDFSMNAMAVVLAAGDASWGDLLDPFGGKIDLERGLIKVLHERSFVDDATRILRGVRYAGRFGFEFEGGTLRLLRRELPNLDTIKGDRVRREFERIFAESRAAHILRIARDLGALSAVYRPLNLTDFFISRLAEIDAEDMDARALLFLSVLACSVQPNHHEGFIARLNMNAEWAKVVRDAAAVSALSENLKAPRLKNGQLYLMLHPYSEIAVGGCAIASDAPLVAERLELFLNELRFIRPSLDGNDIMALGVPQGPQVGALLRELLAAKLDGLVPTREDEEALIRRKITRGLS
ncbi:MAG: hypothetical protein L0177_08755 [Chloroflexi bacterium]|nr:hypothetical protein [Chloroflexota bacterium]